MTMEIKVLTLGIAATNCYILGDNESGKAILIDPVEDAPELLKVIEESGWKLELILATHGHFDHILASKPLKEATGAPFYINQRDMFLLETLPEQGLPFVGHEFPEAATPDRFLTDEPETIEVGPFRLDTLFTPGHSPGHISFYMPSAGIVFSGDCLFQGSIGRTDLPGADAPTLLRSISEQLLTLDDDVKVLPGHMGITTIGQERQSNPFLNRQ